MVLAFAAGAAALASVLLYKKYHTASAALAAAKAELAKLKGDVKAEVVKLEGEAKAEVVAVVAKIKTLL